MQASSSARRMWLFPISNISGALRSGCRGLRLTILLHCSTGMPSPQLRVGFAALPTIRPGGCCSSGYLCSAEGFTAKACMSGSSMPSRFLCTARWGILSDWTTWRVSACSSLSRTAVTMHSAARCHCRFSLVFSVDCQRLLSCVRFSMSYPSGDRLGVGSGCAPSLPGMCAILAEDGVHLHRGSGRSPER